MPESEPNAAHDRTHGDQPASSARRKRRLVSPGGKPASDGSALADLPTSPADLKPEFRGGRRP